MVAERRPLGEARGAAGELDVDGVVELQRLAQGVQAVALGGAGQRRHLGEVVHAGGGLGAEAHDGLQMGQSLGLERPRPGVVQLRARAGAACRDSGST